MSAESLAVSPPEVELATGPVSIEPYISAEYFELEREHVFKKTWLIIGRASEVPNNGDFVVKEIEVANVSVLVARGSDGVVRAFHNACSHRLTKIVCEAKGHAAGFVCPYHAWSYRLDGSLRSVPAKEKFANLNQEALGLTPIALDLWQGFLFINLDPRPQQTLLEFLGGLAKYAEGYPFDRDGGVMRIEFPLMRCNWKIALNAFQEAYHFGPLHRQTLSDVFVAAQRPIGEPLAINAYGPHCTISEWVNTSHVPGPVEALAQRFTANINSVSGTKAAGAKAELFARAPGLNPTRDPGWGVDVNVVFPNTTILPMAGSYQVFQFWPLSVDTCRAVMTAYYAEPLKASERFSRECGFDHTKGVVMEDILNCENGHAGIKSRAKSTMLLQEGERAIRQHLAYIDRIVAPHMSKKQRSI